LLCSATAPATIVLPPFGRSCSADGVHTITFTNFVFAKQGPVCGQARLKTTDRRELINADKKTNNNINNLVARFKIMSWVIVKFGALWAHNYIGAARLAFSVLCTFVLPQKYQKVKSAERLLCALGHCRTKSAKPELQQITPHCVPH